MYSSFGIAFFTLSTSESLRKDKQALNILGVDIQVNGEKNGSIIILIRT